ncbi:hypothetical protein [Streptomyces paromomycinus]|uniref:Uncharacterized protein n=1 Tax=Streptomyces paromomycinus TaxID=92743 RepID=A0A401WB85_STREY|nr:hypothetical protein [Streptomyces paromomycinus]GCD46587.1 hypothetical protein GKJPGBOP_06338 [Streptomyces paromomycinus]
MHSGDWMWLAAGVVVTLAFFGLVAYLVRELKSTRRLPAVLAAVAVLIGALPAVLYALYHVLVATQ